MDERGKPLSDERVDELIGPDFLGKVTLGEIDAMARELKGRRAAEEGLPARLAPIYRDSAWTKAVVARVCDVALDPSGALLGRLLDLADEALAKSGGK